MYVHNVVQDKHVNTEKNILLKNYSHMQQDVFMFFS